MCPSAARISEMPQVAPATVPACVDIDPDQLREMIARAVREATQRGRHADRNQPVRGTGVHDGMHRPEDGVAIQAVMNRPPSDPNHQSGC